jgi:hypothetical protein
MIESIKCCEKEFRREKKTMLSAIIRFIKNSTKTATLFKLRYKALKTFLLNDIKLPKKMSLLCFVTRLKDEQEKWATF